jgi:predicted transcriptional regulator
MRAMVTNVTTIRPDQTVGEALAIFKDRSIRNVPVVDKDGKFVGLFGLQQVLLNLLPKAASMEQGLGNLSFVHDAAPGIAKRLRKLEKCKVSEFMNKEPHLAHCDTSTIEALRLMAKHGSPVVVTQKETGAFKGIISRKSLLDNLYGLLEEIEKEESRSVI